MESYNKTGNMYNPCRVVRIVLNNFLVALTSFATSVFVVKRLRGYEPFKQDI